VHSLEGVCPQTWETIRGRGMQIQWEGGAPAEGRARWEGQYPERRGGAERAGNAATRERAAPVGQGEREVLSPQAFAP
jgi:hypothetical protein